MAFFNVYSENFENHFLFFANEVADVSYSGTGDFGDVKEASSIVFVEVSVGSVIHHAFYSGDCEVAEFRPFRFMFRHYLHLLYLFFPILVCFIYETRSLLIQFRENFFQ